MPKQVIIDPTAIGELAVSITHASGTDVPATVDGAAVTWPHSITAKTTFDLTTKDGVVISATYNGTEVAGRSGQPVYGGSGNGTLSIAPGLEALEGSAALAGTYAPREFVLSSPRVARSVPVDDVTFITKFDAGHGWTTSNPPLTNLNSTTRPFLGAQTIHVTGDPGGNMTLDKTLAAPINLSGQTLLLWLYTANTNFTTATLYLSVDSTFADHRIYTIPAAEMEAGEWTCLKIDVEAPSGALGTFDATNVGRIRLTLSDPSGAFDLHWAAFGYVPRQTTYPNGVVTICFDDSADGVWPYARPKLEQYGYPAVIYAIGEYSENSAASGLTIDNLLLAEDALGWEVGLHADRQADHVDLTTLSEAEIDDTLARGKDWLLTNGFQGRHMAYPFGANNADVREAAKRYFSTGRTVGGETMPYASAVPAPTTRLFSIPTLSFNSVTCDTVRIKTAIDRTKAKGLWLQLTFHTIHATTSSGDQASKAHFDEIVDYINAQGVEVVTLSTLFGLG